MGLDSVWRGGRTVDLEAVVLGGGAGGAGGGAGVGGGVGPLSLGDLQLAPPRQDPGPGVCPQLGS